MSNTRKQRVTQVIEKPGQESPGDNIHAILRMIEQGEEPRRIFVAIAECALSVSGAKGTAIFLPSEKANDQQELVASAGIFDLDQPRESGPDQEERVALQAAATNVHQVSHGEQHYFDVICLGAAIGSLVAIAPEGLSKVAGDKLRLLAHHTGATFERQRLSGTLQHFLDRLQVLNELNQLIASNVGLQRIVKSLARESAFRFAADIALAFVLDEQKTALEIKGGYGCAPTMIPKRIELGSDSGIMAQVMRSGGHFSISNLANHPSHGLKFLEELDVRSMDLCCLEVHGEPLGAILIGYRRETIISPNDLTRFEEFCQGAAVAIANARTQERITSYTERLEELVESRTADLAIQTARAEEANHAKSQFLANMSHELRTPLTAIVGYSSVLADGIFGPLSDKQLDALNAITRSSDHLKNLIDDVLNLARIESGKEEPEPAKVSVKDLLTQAHKLMLQTAIGKGVSISPLQLSDELKNAALYVDPKHIHQIIINLMSNAVKYTPKGGKVWVGAEALTDKIKISVSDTGVGIPNHKIEKLFERFERGEDTYSKAQEGTGIGLNLTRRLVELNGGRIGATSAEGEGSTFWILIPMATSDTPIVATPEVQDQRARLDGLAALVVDDNRDTCEVLKHILLAAGATVKTAHSVREGITSLEEEQPDIILTDLAMPNESGLVLISHVRNKNDKSARMPIIVLSACAFESDKDAALNAGASAFIPKPFKPNEVIKNVRQLTLSMAMQR